MARRVSFATTTTTNRLPVADDAWGNYEYLAPDPPAPPPPVAAAIAAAAAPPRPRPPPPPPPLHVHAHQPRFPTLRALCLSTLAQHLFLLADVAASEDPDVLRRALPCADDRLALAAAARRRGELSSTALFTALADPTWPVLSIGSQQPSAQAVTEAARRGLLKGVRRVEWVLPSEVAMTATPTTPVAVLLPSEAASVVRSLAAHCDALEELLLRRAEPTRPTRPAVAAAVAKAVLAAALPKGLLPVSRRRKPGEEDEEEEEPETKQQAEAAPDSWEDALAPADQQQQHHPKKKTPATITFAPSFRLLRWEDLPDAAADAIRERCPRIALDRQRRTATTKVAEAIDAPWLSLLAPKWDDRAALLREKREEERAKREAARGKGLPVVVPSDDQDEDDDEDEEQQDTAPKQPKNQATDDAQDDDSEEDDSLAARFRRAYVERAQRLRQVEKAKEAQRRRREVRASPALRVVERWLDEPV